MKKDFDISAKNEKNDQIFEKENQNNKENDKACSDKEEEKQCNIEEERSMNSKRTTEEKKIGADIMTEKYSSGKLTSGDNDFGRKDKSEQKQIGEDCDVSEKSNANESKEVVINKLCVEPYSVKVMNGEDDQIFGKENPIGKENNKIC